MALTGIWYIIGFAFAAGSFTFLTFGAAWLVSHRNRGDIHKGLPYESGIDTYGDTHGRFGLSFYIYALLFVAFDIEVVFIYLWALIFGDQARGRSDAGSPDTGTLFVSMVVFVAIPRSRGRVVPGPGVADPVAVVHFHVRTPLRQA